MSEKFDKMSRVFTQVEIQDKRRLEGIIEAEVTKIEHSKGIAGKALIEIRDRKLYQIEYDSFEEYGEQRWGKSRAWLYQQIQMHQVVESLPPEVSTFVDTETKARALAAVPPKRRMHVIRDAVETSNGRPTARHIEEAAQRQASPPPKKPEQKDILLDATGWPVPENLLPLFERTTEVKQHLNSIAAIRGMLRRVQENKDQLWSIVNFSATMIDLDRAFQEIKQAVPYAVCPYCSGHEETRSHCSNCHQRGAVSELFWKQAIPEELKAVRAKSSKK